VKRIQNLKVHSVSLGIFALLLAGCAHVGPSTIVQDRFKYNVALRDSWEEQILNNMVGLRYGEAPIFLDVSSVIAQYSLQTSARLSGTANGSVLGGDILSAGASAVWSERPTITYSPLSGKKFTADLLTPIQPGEIFGLIDAGWNAERSLRLILRSINGITAYDPRTRKPNIRFYEVLHAFKILQDEEALGIRRKHSEMGVATYIYLKDVEGPVVDDALETLSRELAIDKDADDIEVVFGEYTGDRTKITLQTLSVLDILSDTSAYIMVPEQHVLEGRTRPTRELGSASPLVRAPLRIYTSAGKPEDALVSVKNRDHWFYLDDKDIDSKKAFAFLMILMQLSSAQEPARGPVVTVGTN
jgi:hypothetical protein